MNTNKTAHRLMSCLGFQYSTKLERRLDLAMEDRLGPTKALPPDPDRGETGEYGNDDRAKWADTALKAFQIATGSDVEDAVADLLADLMHWCDRHGMEFDHELDRARRMYADETHR